MPGTLVGTPSYMSPEQILGLAVGSRADIFATGVILYQFLTGKRPFSGGGPFGVQRKIVQDDPEPPSQVNPEVPDGFDFIIQRALAKQPEDRYENAAAFAADLERIGATIEREVPLIDLSFPDEGSSASRTATRPLTQAPAAFAPSAPALAPAPAPAPLPSAAPPPVAEDPDALTLITAVPFGKPAAPANEPDTPPADPEATIIMFRPNAPDSTMSRPGPGSNATVSGTVRGGPAAPAAPPAGPPRPAATPASAPTARTQPLPPAPPAQQTATPRQAPAAAPAPAPLPLPGRPPAAPRAAPPPTPMPVPAAAPPAKAGSKPAWMPLAAGAGVAVLALTAWLLVARPWASKPAQGAYQTDSATPATPSATAPAPTRTDPPPTPAPTPTTQARPPAADPPAATAVTAPPAAAPASPTPTAAPARPAAAKPPAAKPEGRPAGVEPRCSDLLQRMQLGEPLSAEQTAFFQTRCTR